MFWKKDIKGLLTYDLNHFQMFNGIFYYFSTLKFAITMVMHFLRQHYDNF